MSARRRGVWAAVLLAAGAAGAAPVLIDHRDVDVARWSLPQIERAKESLHIAYGHTSHGSQLTDGMGGLVGFANGGGKGLALPENAFAWNNGGSGGALDLHDYALCNDVGYYPDWVVCTSNYLDDPANADVNVVIWSWCGQMDDKYAAGTLTNEYLAPMAAFERDYPHVAFVYMTGHVDIWDDANNKAACEAIRNWCSVSNRILYDFNDIEHHDPDGTYYEFVSDDCSVYAGAGGAAIGNWATEWQAAHVQNVDWYDCGSAHSQPLNANLKAYAAWALWCRLGADRDRDGIADVWEERHGGSDRFGGGTNDYDHDGATDWEEYVQDSAPTNASPRFRIAGIAPTNVPALEFATATGRVYALKACADLVAGDWVPITNRPGTGAAMTLEDGSDFEGFRAYRVGVSVPD
jgi:hypothetical protein